MPLADWPGWLAGGLVKPLCRGCSKLLILSLEGFNLKAASLRYHAFKDFNDEAPDSLYLAFKGLVVKL